MTSEPTLAARLVRRNGGIWDQDIRYLMLRCDVLGGFFQRLPQSMQATAFAAFAAAVADGGGQSAKRYRQANPEDASALLAVIEVTAGDLGWGQWRFAPLDPTSGALDLVVENSPFAAGFEPAERPVCAPIVGMMQAVGDILWPDREMRAAEQACAAAGAENGCFQVATAT